MPETFTDRKGRVWSLRVDRRWAPRQKVEVVLLDWVKVFGGSVQTEGRVPVEVVIHAIDCWATRSPKRQRKTGD